MFLDRILKSNHCTVLLIPQFLDYEGIVLVREVDSGLEESPTTVPGVWVGGVIGTGVA